VIPPGDEAEQEANGQAEGAELRRYSKEEDNPRLAALKAKAQTLKPLVRVGHEGVSEGFLKSLNEALDQHELVKIKFVAMKEFKKGMSRHIATLTDSELVQRVGNTATYFRPKKKEE
jgi:RNA-binding protein